MIMKTLLKSSVFPLAILIHVMFRVYFTSDFLNDSEVLSMNPDDSALVPQVIEVEPALSEDLSDELSALALVGPEWDQ